MSGLLSGVRVVDISHHMAGPMSTQKLGDMGADVIKVEPPSGEWTRSRTVEGQWVEDFTSGFISLNRNKRGVTLNLKDQRGLDLLYGLVRTADVFVLNFRPEVARRLKVDYESLREINPRIVYCAITGFGPDGPGANRPGQDLLVQAYSGVMFNAGAVDDLPAPAGCFVCDASTGSMAVIGILGALFHRERTGAGQKIDVSLLDSAMDVQIQEITTALNTGHVAGRTAEPLAHALCPAPYGIHRTADGFIALAMGQLDVFGKALGIDELLPYTNWDDGFKHKDEVFRLVADKMSERTTDEWLETLDAHGLWAARVNRYEDLLVDPQVQANGTIQERFDERLGRNIRYMGLPIKFSETPAEIARNAPRLGEHNAEVYGELGLQESDIAALSRDGVL